MDIKDLISYRLLIKSPLKSIVDNVYKTICEVINAIPACHKNFTMHDIQHSLRVISYMEQIAFKKSFNNLHKFDINELEKSNPFSDFEIMLILLSGLLHDIGMFYSDNDVKNIENGEMNDNNITFEGILKLHISKEEAIKDIIRRTHADRIKIFVNEKLNDDGLSIRALLSIDNKYNFADDLIEICISHGKDFENLKTLNVSKYKKTYEYNMQYLAVLLRIGDYLDLDSQRTPILWFRLNDPKGISKVEWEKHFIIENEHKFKDYNDSLTIFFDGCCDNVFIYRKFLRYLDDLKFEIENSENLLNDEKKKHYKLAISNKIINNVTPKGFDYADLRFHLNYQAITSLFMGINIYNDRKLGLRELIQNSIDACNLKKEIDKDEISPYKPFIKIIISEKNNTVKLVDNGIGMSLYVLKKYFLNIGVSYYNSEEFIIKNYKYRPIGKFGIGFLACFLLSKNILIRSKSYFDSSSIKIELEKGCEYVVTKKDNDFRLLSGTEITLDYKEFFDIFKDLDNLIDFIKNTFFTDIEIIVNENENDHVIKNEHYHITYLKKIIPYDINDLEIIKCNNFSENIEGTIIADNIKTNQFKKINNNCLIFDKDKFKKFDELKEGYYYVVKYPNIDATTYNTVRFKKSNYLDEMKQIAQRSNNLFYLFINENDIIKKENYKTMLCINDLKISCILRNSNLYYRDELEDCFKISKINYVKNKKRLPLFRNYFKEDIRTFEIEDEEEIMKFYKLFNKSVLLEEEKKLIIRLPLKLNNIYLAINNVKLDLNLDVSRKMIMSNVNLLKQEVFSIMIKYLIKKNSNIDCIFNDLLQYSKNNNKIFLD